ncbi:MAG: DUF4349 domain-containing protein [Actinobacteria bacterium]|nr:DUF4349 domain-containing protein [Actinomycetota bacterium]
MTTLRPGNARGATAIAASALFFLAACGDDDKSAIEESRPVDEVVADNQSISAGSDSTGNGEGALNPAELPQSAPLPNVIADPSRQLIITMTVGVEVADAATAVDKVILLAARHGGQLYDSQLDLTDPETASGDLVFKMPPAEVQAFMSGLDPAVGRRTGLDGTTSDVTTQIADLDAQILAAEASVDRIRALLETAKTLDDVIRLEVEFTNRQTHLEQLRAQQTTLNGLVSLATITVHLTTAPPAPAPQIIENLPHTMDKKGVGAAFDKGWNAFLDVLVALALVVGYSAPFLVLAGLALALVWRVRRRMARARSGYAAPASEPSRSNEPSSVG